MKKSELKINGMGCAGCVDTVHAALTDLEGVKDAVVDLGEGRATVEYDENTIEIIQFEKAVSEAGYKVEKS